MKVVIVGGCGRRGLQQQQEYADWMNMHRLLSLKEQDISPMQTVDCRIISAE